MGFELQQKVSDADAIRKSFEDAAHYFVGVPHIVDLGEHDHELVTAEACHRIRFPNTGNEAGRDLLEELIAGCVAQRVVHELELVEVDEDQRRRLLMSSRPG